MTVTYNTAISPDLIIFPRKKIRLRKRRPYQAQSVKLPQPPQHRYNQRRITEATSWLAVGAVFAASVAGAIFDVAMGVL